MSSKQYAIQFVVNASNKSITAGIPDVRMRQHTGDKKGLPQGRLQD